MNGENGRRRQRPVSMIATAIRRGELLAVVAPPDTTRSVLPSHLVAEPSTGSALVDRIGFGDTLAHLAAERSSLSRPGQFVR